MTPMSPPAQARLKLLVVMPSGQWRGGAEASLLHIAQAREAVGLDLSVVFLEGGNLPGRFVHEGVETTVMDAGRLRNPVRFLRTVGKLRRLLARERPDAVLAWMTKAHLYSGLAARRSGVPALIFQAGLSDGSPIDRLARRIPSAGYLACSEFAAVRQRAALSDPRERVETVLPACEHARSEEALSCQPAEMKRRLGFDPALPLVGTVGRLQRWKGVHVFAEAMAAVFRDGGPCQAVIVGGPHGLEPDYPAFLERRLRELGVESRIRMAGAQENPHEWMQAMDVFVHAAEAEPFGIVVVEAMSLGKPVIATRPGGPEEIIHDGLDGLLVPFGEAATMAEAIRRLLGDAALRERLGHAARERALAFTPEAFARRMRDAIHRLLGR